MPWPPPRDTRTEIEVYPLANSGRFTVNVLRKKLTVFMVLMLPSCPSQAWAASTCSCR